MDVKLRETDSAHELIIIEKIVVDNVLIIITTIVKGSAYNLIIIMDLVKNRGYGMTINHSGYGLIIKINIVEVSNIIMNIIWGYALDNIGRKESSFLKQQNWQ